MMKKPQSRLEGIQGWFNNEIERDKKDLENEKKRFLNEIKNLKKEDIFHVQQKRLTLWERIKKVLMG